MSEADNAEEVPAKKAKKSEKKKQKKNYTPHRSNRGASSDRNEQNVPNQPRVDLGAESASNNRSDSQPLPRRTAIQFVDDDEMVDMEAAGQQDEFLSDGYSGDEALGEEGNATQ